VSHVIRCISHVTCRMSHAARCTSRCMFVARIRYNVCVMAYGQTGSGKTHTMLGASDKSEVRLLDLSVSLFLLALLHAFRCLSDFWGTPSDSRFEYPCGGGRVGQGEKSRLATSVPLRALGSADLAPPPHLHRNWAQPSHICTATLRWDWAQPMPHLHRDCVLGDAALHCHGRSPELH
jgi:hypothetical protein